MRPGLRTTEEALQEGFPSGSTPRPSGSSGTPRPWTSGRTGRPSASSPPRGRTSSCVWQACFWGERRR